MLWHFLKEVGTPPVVSRLPLNYLPCKSRPYQELMFESRHNYLPSPKYRIAWAIAVYLVRLDVSDISTTAS